MAKTTYELHGSTAVITLQNPPVNSLEHDLRIAIVAGLDAANADLAVNAIVLIGSERAFSAGADIGELGTTKALAEPHLATVLGIVEASPKPVIAALGGVCFGGGLELALAAHFRVARRDASLALPEVKLGLLPGAGGTQRLPRLVGVEVATNLIATGGAFLAAKFEGTALIDDFVDGDLRTGALAFASRIIAENRPLKRARDIKIDYPMREAYLGFARNVIGGSAGRFPAPLKCISAVEASVTHSFEEGLGVERRLFFELLATPESRALRHTFLGDRAAARIPDVPASTPKRDIGKVGIVGAGTMGGGIAMSFANAGIPVTLIETTSAALQKGVATVRGNYEGSVKRGRLSREAMDQRMALITGAVSLEELQSCDLIVEAVFEDLAVKQALFEKLDRIAKPGAILATNTSTLDVNAIARVTRRPHDVVGMHFFSPANVMKLLEVVRGSETARDVLATVMDLAAKIGKTAVVSGVCDGFIGNRMLEKYMDASYMLVAAGALPWQVDTVLEKWGMAMGPFRMSDLAGNDIGWAVRQRRALTSPSTHSRLADLLCEMGRSGQKVGRGWYLYNAGSRAAIPDPVVEHLVEGYREKAGLTPRKISDEEIIERCIYALVNEGARILEDGIAARASDIDVVYVKGYGFPAHRGGPMLYADCVGLYSVARRMKDFAAMGDPFWEPAALIRTLVDRQGSLT